MTTTTTDSERTVDGPEAILFDMDGVLLEGRRSLPGTYERAADRAIDELGLEPSTDQRTLLRAYRCDEAVRTVCTELGVELERFWRAKERHATALAREHLENGDRAFHDDVDTAVTVASTRPAAIVSNNRHGTVVGAADRHEVGAAVDTVRGRDPTPAGFHRRKPDPYYLTETLRTLDATTGAYVGDRPKDVLAADRAGLASILLSRPEHPDEELPAASSPEATIRSLEELPAVLDRLDSSE